MQITAIEPQKHHVERVNVYVDGEFRIALAADIAYGAALRVGEPVTDRLLRELEDRDRLWKAREAALNLLAYRPRTAAELRRRLRQKGFEDSVIDACVEDLVERNLVDDSAFAELFARDRVRSRPRGSRRLVQELRARGVDTDVAHAAISDVWSQDEISDIDLARQAIAKWSPRPGEDRLRARRRLYGFLARRGFDTETIREVMSELEQEGH